MKKLTCRGCGETKDIFLFAPCQIKRTAPRCRECFSVRSKKLRPNAEKMGDTWRKNPIAIGRPKV